MQRIPESQGGQSSSAQNNMLSNRGPFTTTATERTSYGGAFDAGLDTESGTLAEYWRILKRRKGLLLSVGLVGATIGYLFTLPQTPVYQVRTSLEIVALNRDFISAKGSSPVNEGGTSSDTVDLQTQVKILQSDSLMDRVLAKLSDGDPPRIVPVHHLDAVRKLLNLPIQRTDGARQQALLYASSHSAVRAIGQTRMLEVTVDSSSPDIAAAYANSLTNEFIDQNIESRWKTTERTGEWLGRQLDDMRVRLQASEVRLQDYAHQAGLVMNDEKTNVSIDKLRLVQEALGAAQADRITKESRVQIASTSPAESLPDMLADSVLRDYQAKITDLRRQEAELRATYTAEYPSVRRVNAQITAVQLALDEERKNILGRIENDYQAALRSEKLLAADYAAQRTIVTGEGEKSVQYYIYKQEVESNRQLYDTMLQQLKQSSLASALRASNIRVVDPAKAPNRPYTPDVPVSAGVGLFGGLFLGAVVLVAHERTDRSIHGPGETPLFLNAPELGIVPSDSKAFKVRIRTGKPKSLGQELNPEQQTADGRVSLVTSPVELISWHSKTSLVAESFRATLVSILFSSDESSRPRVLVVTSGSPSEGKSTIASNLAIAVSEVQGRVLLIDADMRRPRMHSIFGLQNDRGLSDLLRVGYESTEALEDYVKNTGVLNLSVITSGPVTGAATALLYSARMPELLKQLRTQFDTIIIDTPPMLQIPDGRVIGRMADSVILVIRAGKTTRDAAIAATKRFSEDGIRILGTVLNDWNPKTSPNGYYGYSNGYYDTYKSYYSPVKSEA